MVKEKRLRRTWQFLLDHQKNWDQRTWQRHPQSIGLETPEQAACGTSACLAGWAVMSSPKYKIMASKVGDYWYVNTFSKKGRPIVDEDFEAEARKHLGLDFVTANEIFSAHHQTLEDLAASIKTHTGIDLSDMKPSPTPAKVADVIHLEKENA